MTQLQMVIALTTQVFELQTLINKVRNYIDQHSITDRQRRRIVREVSACLALLED